MSQIRVEPVSEGLRLAGLPDVFDTDKWEAKDREILSLFNIEAIDVNPVEASWTVMLGIPDRNSWVKAAQGITRDEFEAVLATVRQEIRKKVAGLDQVRWVVPEDSFAHFRVERQGEKDTPGKRNGGRNGGRGRIQKGDAIPISEVTGGEKERVTVYGKVCDVNWRQNQTGRFDATFVITDPGGSVKVRLFSQEEKIDELGEGSWVLARGRTGTDRYDSEPVVFVTNCSDLVLVEAVCRADQAPVKRVELHLHTKMSALDSILDLEDAVLRARTWGHPAVAVTDHGVVQSFPEAYKLGKKHNVKIIYGLEGYLVEDEDPKGHTYHIVLLARNQEGLRHLYEIVTESHLKHFYRTPRIPRSLLAEKREGLIVGSACEAGELFQAVLKSKPAGELERIASFYDYIEIQPLANNAFLVSGGQVADKASLEELNKSIYRLAGKVKKPCVMTSDAHYLDPEDGIYRTVLLAGKGMENKEQGAEVYLRTTCELLSEASRYLGEEAAYEVVVANPNAIAESVEDVVPVPLGFHYPTLKDAGVKLRRLAEEGARRVYGERLPPIVKERLDKELDAIVGNGFASLYLIAVGMVEKSQQDGYPVGSRGSVGSSLVATCTGITEVNPLVPHYVCPKCHWNDFSPDPTYSSGFDLPGKQCPSCGEALLRDGQDIPFETFMGFHGEKFPDIDLNFSGEEQGTIFKFAEELLGSDQVFRAGTIATVATKTAFGFVKAYAESRGQSLRRAEETRLAKGLEGVKRTTGQHPGGVMVIPAGMDVLDFTPLQHPADDKTKGTVTTHFDYNSISGHLVKVDILGHDNPTMLKMLHELTDLDPARVPMDDPETLVLFSGTSPGDAVGIPEFGTRFVRGMLAETQPKCFGDLVRISGLSHGTDVWANNARDLIRDGAATLDQVIATREDIFLYLMKKGMEPSCAFAIAEKVRKGKPLSGEDIEDLNKLSLPDWYVDSCKKISYLFPKAHAAAYVTAAFRIAYYKVHYPLAFAAAYFSLSGSAFTTVFHRQTPAQWMKYIEKVNASPNATAREQDTASTLEVALDMVNRGVLFERVSLYRSDATKYVIDGKALVPPFTSIPGLGTHAASAIAAARREGPFTSVDDFRRRTKTGKKLCDSLRKEGLFEGLSESEQLSLF